jgi:3-oxoadipate enol-lactonase
MDTLLPKHGYRISGRTEGPWLTLSHPIGTQQLVWGSGISGVEQHFRVLSYDTRGHGSAPVSSECDFDDLAHDVLGLWDHLGIQQSHFAGLSLGGCVGVALAAIAPHRVTSLTVACSRITMDAAASELWLQRASLVETEGMAPVIDATLARWFTDQARAKDLPEIRSIKAMLQATDPRGYAASAKALSRGQSLERLQGLSPAVQYILGLSDTAVPADEIRRYQAATPGATLVEIDGPHLLHVEQPDAFWRSVREFALRH